MYCPQSDVDGVSNTNAQKSTAFLLCNEVFEHVLKNMNLYNTYSHQVMAGWRPLEALSTFKSIVPPYIM